MKKYIKILLIAFVLISLGYVQYKSPNNQNTKQVFNESKKYVFLETIPDYSDLLTL